MHGLSICTPGQCRICPLGCCWGLQTLNEPMQTEQQQHGCMTHLFCNQEKGPIPILWVWLWASTGKGKCIQFKQPTGSTYSLLYHNYTHLHTKTVQINFFSTAMTMCKITIYHNNNHTQKPNIFSDSDFQLVNSSFNSSTVVLKRCV